MDFDGDYREPNCCPICGGPLESSPAEPDIGQPRASLACDACEIHAEYPAWDEWCDFNGKPVDVRAMKG